jgi:hypothetical protein
MKHVSRMIGVALFAFLAACGGNSIGDACENVCDCTPEAPANCVSECKAEAEEDDPSQDCIDCVAGASCDDIFGAGCADECADDEEKRSPEATSQLESTGSDLASTSHQ